MTELRGASQIFLKIRIPPPLVENIGQSHTELKHHNDGQKVTHLGR